MDFSYANARLASLVLAAVLALLLLIIGWRAWQRSRVTPQERERRRRAWLARTGKMGDAVLVDIGEEFLFYCYAVRGVEYTASQDITALAGAVPTDLSNVGSVAVKFDPRNPANSIVLAEEWTGLRPMRLV